MTDPPRRFPPPWTVEEPTKLAQQCFIVKDHNGTALAYFYFEEESGRRTAAGLLTCYETRRIAANIAGWPICSAPCRSRTRTRLFNENSGAWCCFNEIFRQIDEER
jgi:hypothetical protein